MTVGTSGPRPEDELLDSLVPEGWDWATVVREYPIPALAVAAVGGFIIGRWRGTEIVETVSELANNKVNQVLDGVLEGGGPGADD